VADLAIPSEPDVDENGVDLAQIRQMLDLTPAERLSTIVQFAQSLQQVQAQDENRRSG
jgi:hypothetical protein